MKERKPLDLPQYTLAMDLANSITHGAGALFMLIAGGFIIEKAASALDWVAVLSCVIYVIGVFLMFLMSCLYHSLAKNRGKKVLRVLDHDFVFAAIMGTYVPYCLVGLKEVPGSTFPWGYFILAVVWAGSIVGIVLNSVNLKKFNALNITLYVVLGSVAALAFYPIYLAIPLEGLLLLLFGGVAYWTGAVLYGLGGKKNLWFHTVFHVFVLIGAVLMFFSLYFYVI